MEQLDKIIVLFNSLLETLSIIILVDSIWKQQAEKRTWINILLMVSILLPITAINFWKQSELFLVVCYLFIIGTTVWKYKLELSCAIGSVLLSIIVVATLEISLYALLNITVAVWLPTDQLTSTIALIVICSFLFCFGKRLRYLENLQKYLLKVEKNLYYVLIALSSLVFFFLFIFKRNQELDLKSGIFLILLVCLFFFSLYKILWFQKEYAIRTQYEELYYDTITNIRERQHKFMNQLDAIYQMYILYDNYEDLVSSQKMKLRDLYRYEMPNKVLVLENPILVAHIYRKYAEAQDMGLEIDMEFSCSLKKVSIPDIVLIEIIGNLFDNACEATYANQKKEIVFRIYYEQEKLYLQICNEHEYIEYEILKKFFNMGFSTKGEGRGLGLPYIRKLVRKYHGQIEMGNLVMYGKNFVSVQIMF